MRAIPLLAFVVLVSPLAAAPKIAGPQDVKAGGFALLNVEGAGKTVIWSVSPEPIQDAEIAGNLIFTGHAGLEYTATAIVIDFEKKSVEKLKHTVRFLGDPSPPPEPRPPPEPKPPPTPVDPPPFSANGLHVLIVYQDANAKTYPSAQIAAMFGGKVHDYLRAKCVKDADNPDGAFRIWDVDVKLDFAPAVWKAAYAKVGASLPWIVLSDGKTGHSGPLPANTDDLLKLLKKYGGE